MYYSSIGVQIENQDPVICLGRSGPLDLWKTYGHPTPLKTKSYVQRLTLYLIWNDKDLASLSSGDLIIKRSWFCALSKKELIILLPSTVILNLQRNCAK